MRVPGAVTSQAIPSCYTGKVPFMNANSVGAAHSTNMLLNFNVSGLGTI
jgi:hypothetical protein